MPILSWFRCKKTSRHGDQNQAPPRLLLALFPLQEYTTPIHIWAGAIQVLSASESSECRVRKISHCKATSSSDSGHEFLLVHIRHPSGKDAILRAERLGSSTSSNASYTTTAPLRDRQPLVSTAALDRVSVSHDGTTDCLTRHNISHAELLTLSFPKSSSAPNVAHLAALLVTLNAHGGSPAQSGANGTVPSVPGARHSAGGDGAKQSSAWFAYCAVEVLKEVFGGKIKQSKGWVRVPYGGMRVGAGDTVDAVVRRYTKAWEDFSRNLGGRGQTAPTQEPRGETRSNDGQSKVRRNDLCKNGC